MLSLLRIRNFAIVDELAIDFGPGLNVITGETGAGKSIVLKALELLTGKRSSGDVVKNGAEQCVLEGLLELTPDWRERILELGVEIECSEPELLIRRTIDASGKSKCYLNGSLMTAGVLQHLTQILFDFTSQHAQVRLLESGLQRELLDQYGVESNLLREVSEAYHAYAEIRRMLEATLRESEAKETYFRQIGFEREELEAAVLQLGEEEELEIEFRRLAKGDSLRETLERCFERYQEQETGAQFQIRAIEGDLIRSLDVDPRLQEIRDGVGSVRIQLDDSMRSLQGYLSRLENDPARLDAVTERISLLKKLQRKYNRTHAELLAYLERIRGELSNFEGGVFDQEKLEQELQSKKSRLKQLEDKLTVARKQAGVKLARVVEPELRLLHMTQARFEVDVARGDSGPHGVDQVSFLLAANPGVGFQPLAKVASGGELSRVLLVLKAILSQATKPATHIFDEVDAGIGGAVSQVVGERLKKISDRSQVILVTHAPQIASLADRHLLIEKTLSAKKTQIAVRALTSEERVSEIARMLAGKTITQRFTDSARELLNMNEEISVGTKTRRVNNSKNGKRAGREHKGE